MALVNITNVEILDNPAPFSNPFQFEITFECVGELQGGLLLFSLYSLSFCVPPVLTFCFLFLEYVDLEWKVVYVGSAESEEYDQVLDSILVGPIPVGVNKFVLQVSIHTHSSLFLSFPRSFMSLILMTPFSCIGGPSRDSKNPFQ